MGTPAKFQTRRHMIEAVQFDGTPEDAERIKLWSPDTFKTGGYFFLVVTTPEGDRIPHRSNWIVKDSGGFWVCPDDIFQRKYEPEAV